MHAKRIKAMAYHFYINDSIEIEPYYSEQDPIHHFAWCLEMVLREIESASIAQEKMEALQHFRSNLRKCFPLEKNFEEFELQFEDLLSHCTALSEDEIMECLTGIPVGKQGYYLSYLEDRQG